MAQDRKRPTSNKQLLAWVEVDGVREVHKTPVLLYFLPCIKERDNFVFIYFFVHISKLQYRRHITKLQQK